MSGGRCLRKSFRSAGGGATRGGSRGSRSNPVNVSNFSGPAIAIDAGTPAAEIFASSSETVEGLELDSLFQRCTDSRGDSDFDFTYAENVQKKWIEISSNTDIAQKTKEEFIARSDFISWAVGRPSRSLKCGATPPGSFLFALGELVVRQESIMRLRAQRLQMLRTWKHSFSGKQEKWLSSVSPTARKLVGKCNPFFFRHLLRMTNYDDVECASILEEGAEVVGALSGRRSWPWNPTPKDPPLPPETVINESEHDRSRFLRTVKPSDHDKSMWDTAMSDVDGGKIEGPFFSEEGVKKWLKVDKFCLSRRFPVIQGEKCRPCDDALRSLVNRTTIPIYKIKLST